VNFAVLPGNALFLHVYGHLRFRLLAHCQIENAAGGSTMRPEFDTD
jgi:hypothetical protein